MKDAQRNNDMDYKELPDGNMKPTQQEGALATVLAPKSPLHISTWEQAIWTRLRFPGFDEKEYRAYHFQNNTGIESESESESKFLSARRAYEIDSWRNTQKDCLNRVRSKIRWLMMLEYSGGVACAALGYAGGPAMWVYDIFRPVYLVGTLRAETILASYACAAPLFMMPGAPTDNTLVNMRKGQAKVCGIDVKLSKITFACISNLPAMAAPWQAAVVLGNMWRLYTEVPNLETLWHQGWKDIPILNLIVQHVNLPVMMTFITLLAWAESLRNSLHSLKKSGMEESWDQADLRSVGDASNILVWSQVVHEKYTPGEECSDRSDRTKYSTAQAMLEALNIETDFIVRREIVNLFFSSSNADHHWDCCKRVLANNRVKRFGTKTMPHALLALLKSSWVMLLLSDLAEPGINNKKEEEHAALNEVYLAMMLALYSLSMQCVDQLKLIIGLNMFKNAMKQEWGPEGLNEARKFLMKMASRTWKKALAMFTFAILMIVLAIVRVSGAILCRSHIFGITTGCVQR